MDYHEFITQKTHLSGDFGFEPVWMPEKLFDFQKYIVEIALKKGRYAVFADCGLGKTFIQLVWAENIVRKTNNRVLIVCPLAVAFQTMREAEKIGMSIAYRKTGLSSQDKIVITNYERLHYFDANDFDAVVCDESSILKNFDGAIKASIIKFMRKVKYRLLCTATAAPNDYPELGNSSEALGYMGFQDMLTKYFKRVDKTYSRDGKGLYRFNYKLRGHAQHAFWRWVNSWAIALRKPSDIGFNDNGFILPELLMQEHIVTANTLPDGFLFEVPAVGLQEQRDELRRTIDERCEKAAELLNNHTNPGVAWCNLNKEGELLEKLIDGAVNVQGKDSDEKKEESFEAFLKGDIRVIVSKTSIAGFGLNWQHCNHTTFFPSHSYEQYYQAIRRFWRFGQTQPVTVDMISTEGQKGVLKNLKKKERAADKMFTNLVNTIQEEASLTHHHQHTHTMEVPTWL